MAPGVLAPSAGPFLAVCALLVGSGVHKVRRPEPARAALAAAGMRVPATVAMAVGGVEIAAGVSGAVLGRAAALVVAVVYLALAGFAWRLLRRAPATPCACLGASDAPLTALHVAVDVAAAVAALFAVAAGSPLRGLTHGLVVPAVLVTLVGCCVALLTLTLDARPALQRVEKERAS
jgi:hypothetical protein